MKSSVIAAVSLIVIASFDVSHGLGQEESTIESLGHLTTSYRRSSGRRVSDDGSVIVGWSNGPIGKPHGFRWTLEGGMQELAPHPLDDESDAHGVSGDGTVVVGLTYGAFRNATPARWKPDGTLEEPYAPDTFDRGVAYGISGDGDFAVGYGGTINRLPSHAYRYSDSAPPYDLGTIGGFNGISVATDASFDGSVIVGWSESDQPFRRAFRWTAATGVRQLELGNLGPWCAATAVSDDGNTIVGNFDPNTTAEYGFVWTAADGTRTLPKIVAGFSGKSSANDVSADGSLIVGRCDTFSQPFSDGGAACVWKNGECLSLWDLLEHEYPTDLEGWSRLDSVEGVSADGTTLTGHGLYRGDQTAFRLTLRNSPPTVAPIEPVTVECEGDSNVVVLSTAVSDDGNRVTIRWKVNGEVLQEEKNVPPGSTAFEHDFPHGTSSVVVEASDGDSTTAWGTTVTVSDTTAPTLIFATDVVVPTDPTKDYATNVALTPPQVFDLCDGEPDLSHDAPERLPVGQTIVRWRAIDADGNQSTANQRVTVEDREAPSLESPSDVAVYCDWGKVFATLRLTPPVAVDAVTDSVVVKSGRGPRFRIGESRVTWTATDEAGNSATKSMIVNVVNRAPRARPGKTLRIEAKSERGVPVRLDGSASSDPDGHALRYSWRAPGVRFKNSRMSKPLGTFPVGSTVATLTVTDAAGAKKSARLRVVVKLANSRERPRGALANVAFDAAAVSAHRGAASGAVSDARAIGIAHATAAQRLGYQAGERILWTEGSLFEDATLEYATLRAEQARHGTIAATAWLEAYAEEGDAAALAAAIDALNGTSYAWADLAER